MKIHKITCIRIAIILFAVMTVSGCFVGLGPPPLVSGSQVVVDYKNTNASDFVSIPSHANVAIRETSPPTIVIKSPKVSRSLKIIEKNSTISVTGVAYSKTGISKVSINGQDAGLDELGNFWSEVLLKIGENKITVNAIGINNISNTEVFTVLREANSIKPIYSSTTGENKGASPFSGKYYALVIGINEYTYLNKLRTATNDAKSIAEILQNKYGFEVKMALDKNASRENILNELNSYRSKLKPEDNLLIYYAGHGYHELLTDTSYWLPFDAKLDNDTNWLDSKNITDQLKRIISRHVLIVADSCYSGTLTRGVDPALKTSDTRDNYLNKMQEKIARILISSGGNEPVSDAGGNGHSIFAEVLINALTKPEKGIFTAEELHVMHLKESVAGRAEQTPEYKVIRNSGHDGGDFIFVKKD